MAVAIARRLKLKRPLVWFDLESTGQSPGSARIVQIALVKILPNGKIEQWEALVNPERPIPVAATDIHGISDEMASVDTQKPAISGQLKTGHFR